MLTSTLVLSVYFIVYLFLHSLLASRPVKAWAENTFGTFAKRWYRLAYNLFAVITLLPLLPLFAVLPDQQLYSVPSPWRWLMIGGQGIALAGIVATLLQTNLRHFVGLSQLSEGNSEGKGPLIVNGFYACVRHPLYFFSLLLIWLTPFTTVNLLVIYLFFTIYFYVGSIHEERRLLSDFGAAYRMYQKRVPRLLPCPIRCLSAMWKT